MLSEDVIREALRRIGVRAPVRYDEVTASTNFTAVRMAERGAPEWTLVAAGHQTAGRGRLGRRWETEPGQALLFSVVLRPAITPERATLVTLLAGAAMVASCREVSSLDVRCKWPNDLVIDDGKVGGILAEARVDGGRLQHVVLGIGVNTGAPPPGVEEAAGLEGADPEELLAGFLGRFHRDYVPEDPAFPARVLDRYRPLAATLERKVRVTLQDGRLMEGVAADIDPWGALIVETQGSRARVVSGEVAHLRA